MPLPQSRRRKENNIMKLTKSTLQKIIKEEINNMLNERELPGGMDLDPGSAPRAPAGQQKQQQKPQQKQSQDPIRQLLKQMLDRLDAHAKILRENTLANPKHWANIKKDFNEIYTRLNDLDGKGIPGQ